MMIEAEKKKVERTKMLVKAGAIRRYCGIEWKMCHGSRYMKLEKI
jgi:hypothetical protein